MGRENSTPAGSELVLAPALTPPLTDPVREGQGQELARGRVPALVSGGFGQMLPELPAGLDHPAATVGVRLQGLCRGWAFAAEGGQGVEPVLDIRGTVPPLVDIPLREQGGKVAGQGDGVVLRRRQQHVAEARVGRKLGHFFAKRGDPPLLVQGAEGEQHGLCLGEMAGRRRVEPA